MGGKGSAPPPPDYIGAANTQAAASKELTNIQNFANRPTINTPFGSQSWQTSAQVDPATGQTVTSWTQNNSLAPALQSALNAQIGLQNDRSQLAGNFMDRVASEYQRPFDYANLPQMAEANPVGNLQTNVGDYAGGLQTGVDSRANNVVSGFNFAGPQMGMSPMTGGLNYGVGQQPLNTGFNGMTGDLRRGTGTAADRRRFPRSGGHAADDAHAAGARLPAPAARDAPGQPGLRLGQRGLQARAGRAEPAPGR
jgi:hypothetical protein